MSEGAIILRSRLMTKTKLVMSASKPRTKSQPTAPAGVPEFVASRAMSTIPIVKESSAEAIAVRKNGRALTHAHAAEGLVATSGSGLRLGLDDYRLYDGGFFSNRLAVLL